VVADSFLFHPGSTCRLAAQLAGLRLELAIAAHGGSLVRGQRVVRGAQRRARCAAHAAEHLGLMPPLTQPTASVCPTQTSSAAASASSPPPPFAFVDGANDRAAEWVPARAVAALVAGVLALAPAGLLAYAAHVPVGADGVSALSPSHTLLHALSYRLDQFFSTNAFSKPLLLLALTAMMVLTGTAALFAATPGADAGQVFWAALAGVGLDWTFAGEGGTLAHRICALFLAVGGLLITALMLGVVSDAIGSRMDDLRKGRSDVLEAHHTLLLGWNDKLLPILRQLALANASAGGGVVVVLAERDKEAMDADVAEYLPHQIARGTKVVCRCGSPALSGDLMRVSASRARAIIVLADSTVSAGRADADADSVDARTLRVLLTLSHMRDHGTGLAGHVVAEVCDIDNEPLMRLVGGKQLATVVSHDVTGRIMLQCALQQGLAFVFEDLLGFDGAEFYAQRWPQLTGRRFGDVARMFPDAVPCGVIASPGDARLNPPDDYVLREDDAVLVIAEDDDSYAPTDAPAALTSAALDASPPPPAPREAERILFVGWRRDLDDLVVALDSIAGTGSELWLFCTASVEERVEALAAGGLDVSSGLQHLTLHHVVGDPVSRRDLEQLPLETFDAALILAGFGSSGSGGAGGVGADTAASSSPSAADSKTLATLLLIRDIQSQRLATHASPRWAEAQAATRVVSRRMSWVANLQRTAVSRCPVISEILDTRTRNLVSETGLCDFVLSNELISNALAMVAEDLNVHAVLSELFTAEGEELRVTPAEAYAAPGERLSFWDVAARARRRREVLIGAYCAEVVAEKEELGVSGSASRRATLNPPDKHALRSWGPSDFFVVIGAAPDGRAGGDEQALQSSALSGGNVA